ncbi:MAG TPA: beta galactosidase jelly roll domain-containing protein [Candidatus Faeciplasma gallinarum]|uniref:Beta galactosidase jelly roll domain-containing protein n=1 Tax=Candidatus Faeciplasma gallinarum TaxID=2840799 RepID=A0A9D1EQ78_9FIRM|nr:beta galactosidase jelly roll domain-containing protein [Candidatus Faeciplasma gallinarum]
MEREVINFNTDWLYAPADYKNGEAVDLDDSEFEAVSLPHANKIIEKHKGPEFEKEIESYRFVSWYRRHFEIDESYLDKRVFVEFEGVATVADVYVNGEYVDTHKGAYTGFTVDITDYIHEGANVLAVRVDSERQTEVSPEGGNVDYCLFGGIVRDVNMIVTSPAYISNTFITTPELSAESGKAAFEVTVNNLYDTEKTLSVTSEILDNDGTVVAEFSDEHSVAPNSEVVFESVSDAILSPNLWSTDDPYLYTVRVTLSEGDAAIDSVWYGSTAPSHGIMILNLDGEEQEIDCYSEERRDSVVIFDSGEIENTEHTLTVTVTGRENDLATDRFINVDRVRVYQTK